MSATQYNMYCHKICSTRYVSEIQRNVIYFQILFDDERVPFCPTWYVANTGIQVFTKVLEVVFFFTQIVYYCWLFIDLNYDMKYDINLGNDFNIIILNLLYIMLMHKRVLFVTRVFKSIEF